MRVWLLFLGLVLSLWVTKAFGDEATYSGQYIAFAPNAGGQNAYALRRFSDGREWSLFANTYLQSGTVPLSGALYSWRYSVCPRYCVMQFYTQAGLGLSTAGPTAEVLWGTAIFWLFRVDFGTQVYLTNKRLVFWSYPLWAGISVTIW